MTKRNQYIVIAILAIVIALLLWRGCNSQKQLTQTIGLYESTQDTLHTTRNKLGQQEASIALMEASNVKLFLQIQSKDSTLIQLQGVVKDYKGKLQSASVFSNITSSTGVEETTTVGGDTVYKDSLIYIYEEYTSKWNNKWEYGNIRATKDSIYRNNKIINEFEMTLGDARDKWWKPKYPTVEIKNLNPNTATTELKTFNITTKPKRLGIGLTASYGFGTASLTPQFFIGAGVNYNVIEFKTSTKKKKGRRKGRSSNRNK